MSKWLHAGRPFASPQRNRSLDAQLVEQIQGIPCLITGTYNQTNAKEMTLHQDVQQIQVCCHRLLTRLEVVKQSEQFTAGKFQDVKIPCHPAAPCAQTQELSQQLEISNTWQCDMEKELVDEQEILQKEREGALFLQGAPEKASLQLQEELTLSEASDNTSHVEMQLQGKYDEHVHKLNEDIHNLKQEFQEAVDRLLKERHGQVQGLENEILKLKQELIKATSELEVQRLEHKQSLENEQLKNIQQLQGVIDQIGEEHNEEMQKMRDDINLYKQQLKEALQLGRQQQAHEQDWETTCLQNRRQKQEDHCNRTEHLHETSLHIDWLQSHELKLQATKKMLSKRQHKNRHHCRDVGRPEAAQLVEAHCKDEQEMEDEIEQHEPNMQTELAHPNFQLSTMKAGATEVLCRHVLHLQEENYKCKQQAENISIEDDCQPDTTHQLQPIRDEYQNSVRLLEAELSKSNAVIAMQTSEIRELEGVIAELRLQAEKQDLSFARQHDQLQETWHKAHLNNCELTSEYVGVNDLAHTEQCLQEALNGLYEQLAEYQRELESPHLRSSIPGDSVEENSQSSKMHISALDLRIERWQRYMSFMQEHVLKKFKDADEGLRLQNRELMRTIWQFNQDCEFLEVENCSLKATMSIFEQDLDRVTNQNAQLIGHVNHRQKIRHTMKMKEEINRLLNQLNKARKRIVQLEVSKDTESLVDVLSSHGVSLDGWWWCQASKRPMRLPSQQRQGTPRTAVGQAGQHEQRKMQGSLPSCGRHEDVQMDLAETQRRCHEYECALEHITINFQHLCVLIERAVQCDAIDFGPNARAVASTFPALIQQLRDVIVRKPNTACRNFLSDEV